jgi:DNA-directed RNA polymerase subunit M/transcription elongation factor TFIIS
VLRVRHAVLHLQLLLRETAVSLPASDAERNRYRKTEEQAGPAENVASTACPQCGTRFVLLARFRIIDPAHEEPPVWMLRCVNCGYAARGELKIPDPPK